MAIGTEAIVLPRPFGPYTLTRRIAVGGMAEVYEAKTQGISGFEKRLAIKVIHPSFSEDEEFVTMLVEEAKLSVLLSHNNVVQTFDLGRAEGTYFIAMEFVEGADCARILNALRQRSTLLPLDICSYLVSSVCSALDYAHRKRDGAGEPLRIVHRDVSPQNVLISFSGDVKLADFGIAKAARRTQNTLVGNIKGKYGYMSPEQASAGATDHRSDIFSAGLVLHELLTGRAPYQADTIPALLDRARDAELRPPSAFRPNVPPELDAITMRALAHRPGDRFESAHDFGQALTGFLYQHNPSFTTARVSHLLARLFTQEYAAATGASVPPPRTEDAGSALMDARTSLSVEPSVGDVHSSYGDDLGEDEATLVEELSLGGRLSEVFAARTLHEELQDGLPGPSSIPTVPRVPREAAAIAKPVVRSSAPRRTRQRLLEGLRWLAIAVLVGGVTYMLVAALIKPSSRPVLLVDSVPSGATVWVDGRLLPNPTPTRVDGLAAGQAHTLELHFAGHERWTTRLRIQAGEQEMVAPLVPEGRVVMVVSEPPGAAVTCAGVAQGRTPLSLGRRALGEVLDITVTIEGREPETHRLEVVEGEGTQTLRVLGGD